MARIRRSSFPRPIALQATFFSFILFSMASSSSTLKVGEGGAGLHVQADPESEKIASLEAGEVLTQLFETVGLRTWYLVRTQGGLEGWVSASDVGPAEPVEREVDRPRSLERFGPSSTWIAQLGRGRTMSGTWSGVIDPSTGAGSGSWRLLDPRGRILMRGTWSANKRSGRLTGRWRARVSGQAGERTGTWSTGVRLHWEATLADLFELSSQRRVSGSWQTGSFYGTWIVRAAPVWDDRQSEP